MTEQELTTELQEAKKQLGYAAPVFPRADGGELVYGYWLNRCTSLQAELNKIKEAG